MLDMTVDGKAKESKVKVDPLVRSGRNSAKTRLNGGEERLMNRMLRTGTGWAQSGQEANVGCGAEVGGGPCSSGLASQARAVPGIIPDSGEISGMEADVKGKKAAEQRFFN